MKWIGLKCSNFLRPMVCKPLQLNILIIGTVTIASLPNYILDYTCRRKHVMVMFDLLQVLYMLIKIDDVPQVKIDITF